MIDSRRSEPEWPEPQLADDEPVSDLRTDSIPRVLSGKTFESGGAS
jgi:hypothetical protein